MTSIVVGYFEDYAEAERTEQDLIRSGLSDQAVEIMYQQREQGLGEPEQAGISERHEHEAGLWERIKSKFGFASHEERGHYELAAAHGGALLTAHVADERADEIADIIERHHPTNLDQRIEEWRATAFTAQDAAAGAPSEQTIPVVQEELAVEKRAVSRGGVRIHTYVTEQPVEQQVTLREEQAVVERIPVDRPVEPGEQAFQERTIEVTETGEVPVVSKQARVVEEVKVGKEATERTETVTDTVRREDVEVEKEPSPKT